MDFWKGDFGKKYTGRNACSAKALDEECKKNFGRTKTSLDKEFLKGIDKNIKILEVGCNVAQQLRHLQIAGFKNLYGIELQWDAVERAKLYTKHMNIIQGSAFDLPFKDGYFDLVFTSGVLIHIAPKDLLSAMKEIYRCTNKYIWGLEYYADKLTEINYRGHKGFLWKQDFAKLYLKKFNGLKLLKEKRLKYADNDNIDTMFLLKKKNAE
jgi:pseudaminic acid biosynthesis-associated methylase